MTLLWKLLRQNISISQFAGFFLANLFGMSIVLFAWQFYCDVVPVFTSADSFMKADYLVVSKKIGAAGALGTQDTGFDSIAVDELKSQPFVKRLGQFSAAAGNTEATMSINGVKILSSEIFFESVPDTFVDAPANLWHYTPGNAEVPVILPRSYITMYNFGFARSRSLPKISEGLAGMINLDILLRNANAQERFRGKVIGFSSRLNTILVPQSFVQWSNNRLAPNINLQPQRLIVEVDNPADNRISQYLENKGYELEDNNLDAEKTASFLRLLVSIVMSVGIIISALSFYVLLLSIFLLVQKNASKLETLQLIGYSPTRVSLPYQLLAIGLNLLVLLISVTLLASLRPLYIDVLESLFPNLFTGSIFSAFALGTLLLLIVSAINIVIIRRKVMQIWRRRETRNK